MSRPYLERLDKLYSNCQHVSHYEHLCKKETPQFKNSYLHAIMPVIMSSNREPIRCYNIFHPGKTCREYFFDVIKRKAKSACTIHIFTTLIPQLIRYRKDLMSGDKRKVLRAIKQILYRYIRSSFYFTFAISLAVLGACFVNVGSDPFKFLTIGQRVGLFYALPPSASIIIEQSSKLPAYSGFYVSKAISHAWALLKINGVIPSQIPLEKYIGLALLTALFGLVSVLKGRLPD